MVFTEEVGEDDLSGSSDDEDGVDSEDSDQDEQGEGEDEDEDNLSSFLKEARAGSAKNDSAPPAKKQKVEERKEEMPAFADSEDELEMSEEEGEAWRAGDSGHCSEEEDSAGEEEEDDEEEEGDDEEEDDDNTTVKKQTASEEEEDEQGKYRTQILV